ncbi:MULTISPECIES: cysteine peptidase family C39 domain-containing protein [Bradyrhizobium]|uniref:hypothetical protein n=1 Tax=Bradyrhizobium pachyrhizi TaxID=280333 RepID=UPI000480F4E8|nr:hypothetical protein [Bradyrhizobium pachyrhizi]
MPDFASSRILVPSTLRNLNIILDAIVDRPSAPCLGCVWGFAEFDPSSTAAEFDLPCGWRFYAQKLLNFAGIQLDYAEDGRDNAYDRVELGQSIIAAVDSYYLPYRPAWQRVHSARTLIVDRLAIDTGMADIIDVWMPEYAGPIELSDLDHARNSHVPENIEREPLYAGIPLRERWWTVALVVDPLIRNHSGVMSRLSGLVSDAMSANTLGRMAKFRHGAVEALSRPLAISGGARRAAALQLRAEIGLRAYLYAFFNFASAALDDQLFAAEVCLWSRQLDELSGVRDLLIKSVAFDRPEYAQLADRALRSAEGRERRLTQFVDERCPQQAPDSIRAGGESC